MGSKPQTPRSTEITSTITLTTPKGDRHFNIPTIERRSGRRLGMPLAVKRAKQQKLLGEGYKDLNTAVKSAEERSKTKGMLGQMGVFSTKLKDPKVTGGRVPRYGRMSGRLTPYNPGGAEPRGGGGFPRQSKK